MTAKKDLVNNCEVNDLVQGLKMVSNKESTGLEKRAKPQPISSTSTTSSTPKVPPDGKWGWVIVIAYGLANVRERERVLIDMILHGRMIEHVLITCNLY